jgi:hypothetical protein
MAGSSRPRFVLEHPTEAWPEAHDHAPRPYVPVLTPVPLGLSPVTAITWLCPPVTPRWYRDPWSFVTPRRTPTRPSPSRAGYRWHRPVSGSAHGDVCVPSRRVVPERRRQETAAALADATSLSRSQRFSGCSLPQAVPMPTAVESRERIFSTRIEPSRSPDRGDFEAKFRRSPGASLPPSLGSVRAGSRNAPHESCETFHGGTQLAAPAASVCQRSIRSEDADFDQEAIAPGRCRSLPAARPPRFIPEHSALAAPGRRTRSTWTGTGSGARGAVLGRATPYYECQYYRSRTYKIVSGIDFRFGRNGVFGRIYL